MYHYYDLNTLKRQERYRLNSLCSIVRLINYSSILYMLLHIILLYHISVHTYMQNIFCFPKDFEICIKLKLSKLIFNSLLNNFQMLFHLLNTLQMLSIISDHCLEHPFPIVIIVGRHLHLLPLQLVVMVASLH